MKSNITAIVLFSRNVLFLFIISFQALGAELPHEKVVLSYYFPLASGESTTTGSLTTANIIEGSHTAHWNDTNRAYYKGQDKLILFRVTFSSYMNYASSGVILDLLRGKYDDNGTTKYVIDETYNGIAYDGISIDEVVGSYFDPNHFTPADYAATTRLNRFIEALEDFRAAYPNKIINIFSATNWQNENVSNFSTLMNGIEANADLLSEEIYLDESTALENNWTYPEMNTRITGITNYGSPNVLDMTVIVLGTYYPIMNRASLSNADHISAQLQYIKNDSSLSQTKGVGFYAPLYTSSSTLEKINKSVMDIVLCQLYLRLDETSGSIAEDISCWDNHGTLVTSPSSPAWEAGKFGNALNFDGTDDYIDCSNDSSLELEEFTYAAWIYPHTISPQYQQIIGKGSIWDKGFFVSYGGLRGTVGQSTTRATTTKYNILSANIWQHVAMTYKNNEVKLYLNGQLLDNTDVTLGSGTVTSTSDNSLLISNTQGQNPFDGLIDDVRIYSNALSENDIAEVYNDSPLQLRLRLDESPSSSTTKDSSGFFNDGTLNNFPTSTCWVTGRSGYALAFDGSDDYLNCGSDSSLDLKKFTSSLIQ